MHLLSFTVDIISWSIIGLYIGHLIYKIESKYHNSSTTCYPLMLLVALVAGFFSTLNRALPVYGFALDIFLETLTVTLLVAAILYKNFRTNFFDERRWTI